MAFCECPDCGTKLPYAGKPHACRSGKSSGGGGESRPTSARGSGPLSIAHNTGDACSALEPPKRAANTVGRQQEPKRKAGVAPSPPETKPKRGRPRIGEVRDKPWLKCVPPMSKTTWYRRQEEARRKKEQEK